MKIGPKYKIARRLGSAVFEKTQTPKFILSEQKRKKKFSRPRSNYALQLTEKQKVKFTYAITERQLRKYIVEIIEKNDANPADSLFSKLESRLDSVILRSGMAKTRFQAKQAASHGHFMVNKHKATVPSIQITETDTVILREPKKESPLYLEFKDNFQATIVPSWISVDPKEYSIKLISAPKYNPIETHFDLLSVIQFYKR